MELLALASVFGASVLFAWSLAAPPGPGNAFIAHEAARHGLRPAFLTGAGAIAADLVMFLLTWLGVLRLLALFPWVQVALGVVGAGLLVKFAVDAWRVARAPALASPSARGSFAKSFFTILSSPFNHAWWLTVGTSFFGRVGIAGGFGFFSGLVAWVVFWAWLSRLGAARIRGFSAMVSYGSAIVLIAFAALIVFFAAQRASWLLA